MLVTLGEIREVATIIVALERLSLSYVSLEDIQVRDSNGDVLGKILCSDGFVFSTNEH